MRSRSRIAKKQHRRRNLTSTPTLDAYDLKILKKLSIDGRITWSDLAEDIGLSLTPTIRRVRQLEEAGYISGYFARLDEKLLAGGMIVFVSVTLERQVREVLDAFEAGVIDMPEIMSGFLMSGGSDYLLRSVVRDLDHYRAFLDELTRLPGVAHIQSSFALNSFVNRPSPLIRAAN
ncbi:Lrp/AsnC family transcriptional regulator [Sphingomonas cavernae]|uniref:Lrp/AsnC family transcriptional regulator n=2 Tax=Sphingomonas cavernae TaxID=2320861 RepID=A0A418WN85_9SPHN|nr:Lrp/AsnC family transcriptional regulator [Sphingomonas cavernae]